MGQETTKSSYLPNLGLGNQNNLKPIFYYTSIWWNKNRGVETAVLSKTFVTRRNLTHDE